MGVPVTLLWAYYVCGARHVARISVHKIDYERSRQDSQTIDANDAVILDSESFGGKN